MEVDEKIVDCHACGKKHKLIISVHYEIIYFYTPETDSPNTLSTEPYILFYICPIKGADMKYEYYYEEGLGAKFKYASISKIKIVERK
ncbi:hypothetical protein [Candidatus Nitrosocosmicus sp. T]